SSRSTKCWPTRKKRSRPSDVDCVAARHCGSDAGSPPPRHHHGWHPPSGAGPRRGADAGRRVVRGAGELGIPVLTLFAFSTENWTRPADEVNDLVGLLRHYRGNTPEQD